MSIKFILHALEAKIGNPARKLVLIKLADNANDAGFCHPSYQHIADHCEIDRRTVIRHIDRLKQDGFLTISARKSPSGSSSNGYQLALISAPNSTSDLVTKCHHPSDKMSPPPSDKMSPRTCHSFEPVKEKNNKKEKPVCKKKKAGRSMPLKINFDSLPDSVSILAAREFIDHRKILKKPLTQGAFDRQMQKAIKAAFTLQVDPDVVILETIDAGWQGINGVWLENRRRNEAGGKDSGRSDWFTETLRRIHDADEPGMGDAVVCETEGAVRPQVCERLSVGVKRGASH